MPEKRNKNYIFPQKMADTKGATKGASKGSYHSASRESSLDHPAAVVVDEESPLIGMPAPVEDEDTPEVRLKKVLCGVAVSTVTLVILFTLPVAFLVIGEYSFVLSLAQGGLIIIAFILKLTEIRSWNFWGLGLD